MQFLFGPFHRIGIGALAGEEEGAEMRQVIFADETSFRILLLDGAKSGRCGEQRLDAVLGNHAPEGAGIGRSDRLAFEENGGRAVQQGRIDDIGMANDPTDIGSGPEGLSRCDAIDIRHRPFERHHVPAIVAHHALRLAGGA